ncbi:16S rRNA (guanine(527)-N(7))-methyltransferase RsmG [Novosphingobium sp. PC22D]|uniref:16S rRNA (guanine(527)-N(7))-methyltransferase RsmG n=1 Tax=Novosphingobium sp. PC22D TaxID=1962403 RepID=UPI000BF09937|nr:16S rRNA (guanine(527)-N(7))-methyltransferase RsmG [Novosphingobium sp. PC22D]PEQ12126.1 16S rRNA (guanine(527)-N(7))-methyltransferase RsmG [Novosphingobium sp. PC22D]
MIDSEEAARAWFETAPGFDGQARERLELLAVRLREENARQNLVAAPTLESVWQRHFADSAQLLTHVPRETRSWLDLGSGAGFPGLVIGILRPNLRVHLVESRNRRIDWLERMRSELGLDRVQVAGSRLELVETFPSHVISARAFAPMPKLLDLSARFSTIDTTWVLPKGRSAAQELQELRGWRHKFHVEQSLTDPSAGLIVGTLIGRKKVKRT